METDGGDGPAKVDVDLSQPRYDLSTYWGRVRHFAEITDFRLAFASNAELYGAKDLLETHRSGAALPPGTTADDLYEAKRLYESAFHPQSGELMSRFGRMSFSAPGNTIIGAGMLTFYRSTPAVLFWHATNQSFNALLNYVNRNTSSGLSDQQLATSFVTATGSATAVALGLNRAVSASPTLAAGLVGRLVPFAAVAAANCVNVPLMRRSELSSGIALETDDGRPLVDGSAGNVEAITSTAASERAVKTTVLSRVMMAVPGMMLSPLIVTRIHRRTDLLRRLPQLELALQTVLAGFFVAVGVPLGCAMFPQRSSLALADLEPQAQARLQAVGHDGLVYFNKGL